MIHYPPVLNLNLLPSHLQIHRESSITRLSSVLQKITVMSSLYLLEHVVQILLSTFSFMYAGSTRIENAAWAMEHLSLNGVVKLKIFGWI